MPTRKKYLANSVWVTAYPCRPFHFLYQKLFHSEFMTDFLFPNHKGKGCSVDRSRKTSLWFLVNFCTLQFEVDSHWAEQDRQRGKCSWNVLNVHSWDALSDCPLTGFYPFSLVWQLPKATGITFKYSVVSLALNHRQLTALWFLKEGFYGPAILSPFSLRLFNVCLFYL